MSEPVGSRPFMPGYGTSKEPQGMLPFSWAEERLVKSHSYWLATVWPDGKPHVMPVWAVWDGSGLWFSSSLRSRKIRNLMAEPRCVVTAEDTEDPVIVEGVAEVVADTDAIRAFLDASNEKYRTNYPIDFLDPAVNATVHLRPRWIFALQQDDFSDSPTRWVFPDATPPPPADTSSM